MNRTSKRGRTLRARQSRSGIGYVLLVFTVVLLAAVAFVVGRIYARFDEFADQVHVTPVPVTGRPTPPPPSEPFNILLIGLDRREKAEDTRNDVNIVVHVDPPHRFASMLSIPRDLLVDIPGYRSDKINAAYGEGGPVLVRETIEQLLDIQIDYFAEVDFHGFERIIDLFGGVTVDVPYPLVDNEYPTEDYGYTRIYIPAGLQHMDGQRALQYARSRHADDDLRRNQRQQQVLVALGRKILRWQSLTDLDRLERLLTEIQAMFKTDMQSGDIKSLIWQAPQIKDYEVLNYTLGWDMVHEISGTTYLVLNDPAAVREMARRMQVNPALQRAWEEGATIKVLNGTSQVGLAGRTAEYLLLQGLDNAQVSYDNADTDTYTRTLLLDGGDHVSTRRLLVELLRIGQENIRRVEPDSLSADIVVILGSDFVLPPQ